MIDFINNNYYIIKWIHYLAFVSWMAGLFYLPRLFVYHAENKDNQGFVNVVKIQEKKLYFYIQTPAMIATAISGSLMMMVQKDALMVNAYMHVKLTCALLLIILHFHNLYYLIQIQKNPSFKSGRYFRIYNEIPTILFMIIAYMMVIKPF